MKHCINRDYFVRKVRELRETGSESIRQLAGISSLSLEGYVCTAECPRQQVCKYYTRYGSGRK